MNLLYFPPDRLSRWWVICFKTCKKPNQKYPPSFVLARLGGYFLFPDTKSCKDLINQIKF